MLSQTRIRLPLLLSQIRQRSSQSMQVPPQHRSYSTTDNPVATNESKPKPRAPNVSKTNAIPTSSTGAFDRALQESPADAEEKRVMQAPNREGTWSARQRPRGEAMVGPRFEQTIMEDQPRPYSAMELIHKQPVRWTHKRQVACDGGGGPLGHPRIFINLDKPQVCHCTYCGLPFANEHNREFLESLPSTPYPLEPTNDPAQVGASQSATELPFEHR